MVEVEKRGRLTKFFEVSNREGLVSGRIRFDGSSVIHYNEVWPFDCDRVEYILSNINEEGKFSPGKYHEYISRFIAPYLPKS